MLQRLTVHLAGHPFNPQRHYAYYIAGEEADGEKDYDTQYKQGGNYE